jgi:hypothetical protein
MNRQGFIGGSDMRRIMDGDWVSLWEEKTGRTQPEDLSNHLAVQLGTHTEDFNLQWFADNELNATEQGLDLLSKQRTFEMNWEGVPCKGTVDACIHNTHEIVEAKHTYERNTMEGCLTMYMPQIQFYLWIGVKDGCYLSVIFGNRRWESVYIKKDWDYIHKMQVHLKEFWGHVKADTRPFGDDQVAPISIDKIPVDGMTRRDASSDNEFISRCHDYIEQEQSAKSFESAKSDLKAMVSDDEREVYCDLLTIKRDKRGSLRITTKEN